VEAVAEDGLKLLKFKEANKSKWVANLITNPVAEAVEEAEVEASEVTTRAASSVEKKVICLENALKEVVVASRTISMIDQRKSTMLGQEPRSHFSQITTR
jgi:hypothetical protein